MKTYLAALTLCVAALTSCSKEDKKTPVIQDGTYTSKNQRATAGPVIMYAGNHLISNQVFIHDFLQRNIPDWLTDSIPLESDYYYASLDVKGDTLAYFDREPQRLFTDTVNMSPSGDKGRLLTNRKQTDIKAYPIGTLGCLNAAKYVRRNPPSYACIYYDQNARSCPGNENYALSIKDGHLEMPMTAYFFTRPMDTTYKCISEGSYIWDYFNEDMTAHMKPADTLVVQTFTIKLIKQP